MGSLRIWRLSAVGLMTAVCGTVIAAPYTPDYGTAGMMAAAAEAGNHSFTRMSEIIYGSGSPLEVTITAPVILDEEDSLLDTAVIDFINGTTVGGSVTTFPGGGSDALSRGIVMAFTPDANNLMLDESILGDEPYPCDVRPLSTEDWSNAFGQLMGDGTLAMRANFSGGISPSQNNIEIGDLTEWLPPLDPTPVGSLTKMWNATFDAVDSDPGGSIFTSSPSVIRDGADLLMGQVSFDLFSGAIPSGINVWRWDGVGFTPTPDATACNPGDMGFSGGTGGLDPLDTAHEWARSGSFPLPVDASGTVETTGDGRETATRFARVACKGGDALHIVFGVGFSGGSPFTGSAFNPLFLVVDTLTGTANGYNDGFVLITADGDGLDPTSNDIRFVNIGGTGGTSQAPPMFDINSAGQVVAVVEDRTGSIPTYQVRRYDPILNAQCEITGFEAPVVIADTSVVYPGAADGGFQFVISQTSFDDGMGGVGLGFGNGFSGASIDDAGNISFVGVAEVFIEIRDVTNPGGMVLGQGPVTRSQTTTLCYYDAASETLHRVADGGQNGNVLPNTGNGAPDLAVGVFDTTQNTDQFGAESMAEAGGAMAVNFRNGFDEMGIDSSGDGFEQNGGVLDPGVPGEASVRGVIVVTIAKGTVCVGDISGDGATTTGDLTLLLGAFGTVLGDPGFIPAADFNGDDAITTGDLTVLLGDFGCGS